MSVQINENEVDIVITALKPDLTAFLEAWRSIFSPFDLIIIKDPDLEQDLKIPQGFNHQIYTKSDIDQILGPTSFSFAGHTCRYFGYLISNKKYIISIDDTCIPALDPQGDIVNPITQHITNLKTPATPFFFNTLYDPYRNGTDFVRGYPFSLRSGVSCALSCGIWLGVADHDAPTQAVRPRLRNERYVDAVLTVPAWAMMPISGINIGIDREMVGPAMVPGLRLAGEGKRRWETMEDVWSGFCVKVVCDHLGFGVKSGLPYVRREDGGGNVMESLREWDGVKIMEEVVPFFQSVRLPREVVTVEDCMAEIARMVRERLGKVDEVFGRAADAMEEWIKVWKAVEEKKLRG